MVWVDVSVSPSFLLGYGSCTNLVHLDGFFDAGMLLHALKGVNADREQRGEKMEKKKFVGKKLHLNEY